MINVAALGAPATVHEAVEAATRGEAAGWDWLFDRYYRTLVRYVMARTGDQGAAEDIAQEVFVAAVDGIGRLRERSENGVEGWLRRIARNKSVDRIRRMRRDWVDACQMQPHADAGELALSRITAAEVRQALDLLSDDQREVVVRRFILDESLEQVAGATGRPVGAVKSMQHRALASLARICRGEAA